LTGVAVAQGGVGVDELEPGSEVMGLPGTRADLEPVAVIPTAPAKTNVWLWVVAIVWPLMIIPGVIAWHVTAESQRNRELAKQNSGLLAFQEELKNEWANEKAATKAATTRATAAEAALGNEKAATKAATTRATAAETSLRSEKTATRVATTRAVADEAENRELRNKLDKANQPASAVEKPAPPKPDRPDPLSLAIVDLFDDRRTLLNPAPNVEKLRFLNPFHIKGFQSDDNVPLKLRYSDPQSTHDILVGTATSDSTYGLMWTSGPNSRPDAIKYKDALSYCGISICDKNGNVVQQLQFGQPGKTLILSNSKNPIPVFSKEFAPPAKLKLLAVNPPSGWECEFDESDLKMTRIHISSKEDRKATFDIIFNTQKNTFESNWTEQFTKLDEDIQHEKDAASQASKNEAGYEQDLANANNEDNKDGQKQTHIGKAKANINSEEGKMSDAQINAKKIEDAKKILKSFPAVTIKVSDPATLFTLCLLKVQQ
jgi:hypothetical protein